MLTSFPSYVPLHWSKDMDGYDVGCNYPLFAVMRGGGKLGDIFFVIIKSPVIID